MTRDAVMTIVRADAITANPAAAGYVLHVYSRAFNPEDKPYRCPFCSADAVHRIVKVDDHPVNVLACKACEHLTALAGTTVNG